MDNINDIIASLTPGDIEMLKGVASSILGGTGSSGQNEQSQPQQQPQQSNFDRPPAVQQQVRDVSNTIQQAQNMGNLINGLEGLNFGKADFEMMMKAKTIFDKMNSTHNKNVDLIQALKPHLSPQTRDKADQAMKILRLFEVLPMLKELF